MRLTSNILQRLLGSPRVNQSDLANSYTRRSHEKERVSTCGRNLRSLLQFAQERCSQGIQSIKEMVAALQCDYDRLEELREDRDGFDFDNDANAAPDGPGYASDAEAWAGEFPELAEELKELEEEAGDCDSEEQARERIQEDPLSVLVRSGWYAPGASNRDGEVEPEEFEILLCTGGPACRIRGELDQHCQPKHAYLQYQDWGTPWTELITTGDDHDALLTYCQQFYFGD